MPTKTLLFRLGWTLCVTSLALASAAGAAQGWFTEASAGSSNVISGPTASVPPSSDLSGVLGPPATPVPTSVPIRSPLKVSAQAALSGPLAVAGNRIVDAGQRGSTVSLRGVNIMDWTLGSPPGGVVVDAGAVRTLVDWGANMVRLGISSDNYLQQCSEAYDPNYRTELTDAVNQLTAAGIYVILDIHSSNPNCLFATPQTSNTAALPGPDVTAALAALARTFGANPMVGFEPFNEPQACASATSGPGASQFFPSSADSTGTCSSEQSAALAWNNGGTVEVQGMNILGSYILGKSYQSPGMDGLYQTIMQNVPAGAAVPLIFLDANYFASDPSTFDNLQGPLAGASNVVEVFHPYDCQDTPNGSAVTSAACQDTTPETCSTTSRFVQYDLIDPATGRTAARPIVFDEINFPAGEDAYWGQSGQFDVPITVYQQGYWVNNMIAGMQTGGAAGWAIFYFQSADVDHSTGPYAMLQPGITAATPTPWPVSSNDAPAVAAMGGAQLSCESPPLGFG